MLSSSLLGVCSSFLILKGLSPAYYHIYELFTDYNMIFDIIITDDYCRVVLSGDEREDYINASHIDVSLP